MTIDHIKKEFPNLVVKDLQGGCNVYLPGELVLTFWFKKRKWKSNTSKQWAHFADTQDALKVISGLGDVQMRKPLVATDLVPVTETNNVQSCIDHIKAKIDKIELAKGNYAVITMLKTVADELQQFL
jgi:hypothetical protein